MKTYLLAIVLFSFSLITFAAESFHEGKSTLSPAERTLLAKQEMKKTDRGFSIIWKNPSMKEFGLLKWDSENSFAVPDVTDGLLESIRDNIGKLNQMDRKGDSLTVTVTVYKFKKQGFLTNPVAYFEIVARTNDGKPAWIAIDSVKSTQTLAQGLTDTDSAIIGREVYRKMREEFNL